MHSVLQYVPCCQRSVLTQSASSYCRLHCEDHPHICLSMHHYAASHDHLHDSQPTSVAEIKEATAVGEGAVHFGLGWDFFVLPCSPFESMLLIPDTSHSQSLHQRPDKIQTGPSPSLAAVVKWALDLFVQGERASWAVMGHNSWPVPRNKWLATHLIFLSFFSIIKISYTLDSHQSLSALHTFSRSQSASNKLAGQWCEGQDFKKISVDCVSKRNASRLWKFPQNHVFTLKPSSGHKMYASCLHGAKEEKERNGVVQQKVWHGRPLIVSFSADGQHRFL